MLKKWILISVISCLFFNFEALIGKNALLLFLGEVAFIFSLYKIATEKRLTGWWAILGIVNFFGLIILLLIPSGK
jgi:hypothetical protein